MGGLDEPRPHRFRRADYHRMAEAGVLGEGDRVELLDGEIVDVSPMGPAYAVATALVQRALERVFGERFWVRPQLPVALDDFNEPEPDLAVVAGDPREYVADHPSTALLLVEVAQTSLNVDRGKKGVIYARHQVPEYWIVNLADRTVEVHRRPVDGRYLDVTHHGASEAISPLAAPTASVSVADLLP